MVLYRRSTVRRVLNCEMAAYLDAARARLRKSAIIFRDMTTPTTSYNRDNRR